MAVKNEIPAILNLRDNLEANYKEQIKHWIDVYNVVLAVGNYSVIIHQKIQKKRSHLRVRGYRN